MPKVILPTTPPFNLLFFRVSARFRRIPPGSAGFLCRVLPGSCRVPLGSAAPLGSARFRWVPGFLRSVRPGFAGFAPQGSCSRLPLQIIAKIVPGSCQASAKVAAIKEAFFAIPAHCPSQPMEKITNKMASLVEWQIFFAGTPCRGGCNIDFHCSAFPH